MKLPTMLGCVLMVAACTQDKQASEESEAPRYPPRVYTVNYPLAYFAERIAGGSVKVVFSVPPGVDPAIWSPDAETIADYQQADLVLLNGAGYAGWLQRATLSPSRLVDTSAAFAEQLIPVNDAVTHRHGPGGDHSHQGMAFTTWLNMEFAIGQARAVFDSLIYLRPENELDYRERMHELEKDLGELDTRLKVVAERIGDQPLLFSHPVYQYLIRGYELNGRSVHWEPVEIPGDDQWRELFELLATHNAGWMIWEDEPLPDTVSRLESMGIKSLVFRPCGNRPAEGNLLSVMLDNVMALEQAFPASASVVSF
ncbi:MAG: zinc ABC transporter substrate-binding protein [Proteobacteria bacterium]|nr:zinc ABC transporter substrate-binding protein [Pseudomonadota bacterium]